MRLASTRLGELARREVETVGVETPLLDCAKKMRHAHVGCLVVAEPAGVALKPLGMLTDRDIVIEAVAPGLDPATLTAGDIMSRPLATVADSDDLIDALARMRQHGVRRLPVVDADGMLCGLISVQDVLGAIGQQLDSLLDVVLAQRSKESTTRP